MPNFIEDGTALEDEKTDGVLRPDIPDDEKVRASDWNGHRQALLDTQGVLRGANWYGLTARGADPEPDDVDNYLWLDDAETLHLVVDGVDTPIGASASAGPDFLSVTDYGAVGDDDPASATANTAGIQAAIAAADAAGVGVYVPPGVYYLEQAGGASFHSLILQSLNGLTMQGVRDRTWFKHIDDVASSSYGLVEMLRISDCSNITIKDIGFDGNWGNKLTYVGTTSDGADLSALPSSRLYADTTGWASSGSFTLVTANDYQVLTYSSITATYFGGVSAGTGTVQEGDKILLIDKRQKTAEVAIASDGLNINAVSSITVDDTTDFPASIAADGYVQVYTASGYQPFQYTSKDATHFLGVTSSGAGVMAVGTKVHYVDGAGNQFGSPMQVDPKNYCVFIYGSDGNNKTPNQNITLEGCRWRDTYGDFVWVGAWSYNVKLIDCIGSLSARNGITLSSFADGVHMHRTSFTNVFTSAVDSEPVDAGVKNIIIDDCELGPWANPVIGSIPLSIQGGVVGRPAEWNFASGWRVSNSRINGSTLITDASDVQLLNNRIVCDFDGNSGAPIALTMKCDNILIDGNYCYSRVTPTSQYNYGCISIAAYITTPNTAAQPGSVILRNNTCHGRNGVIGIYANTVGGYSGESGTATGITAPSLPLGVPTPGTVTDSGASWVTDIHGGQQIVMGGKVANIISNTGTVLSLAPLYENYNSAVWPGYGTSWTDNAGRPVPPPVAGPYVIVAKGGTLDIGNNWVDCRDIDGAGAGGHGIVVTTEGIGGTWAEGFNHMRAKVHSNDVRGATGHGVHVYLYSVPAVKYIEVSDNHIWDDQPVPTCTHRVYFANNAGLFDPDAQVELLIVRNNYGLGVRSAVGGLDQGSWYEQLGSTTRRVGYGTPEGVYAEPVGSTYLRRDGGAGAVFYVKETGGPPVDATGGVGSLNNTVVADATFNLADATTTVNSCLIVCILASLPGSGSADWDQFTNGNLDSFTRAFCETDSSTGYNISAAYGALSLFGAIGVGTARNHGGHNEYAQSAITFALTPEVAGVAPTYVGTGGKVQGFGSADISPPWEGTEEDGDYGVVLVVVIEGDTATCASDGWIELDDSPQVGMASAIGTKIHAFGCRAYKSGMAAPVISYSGGNAMGISMLFRGASAATALGWDAK